VAAARPAAVLRILGPGSDSVRPAVEAHDRVQVVGFVDDLMAELATARVVIAPLWVGGGTRLKVLEAMAAGRPVVGTSVGVERIGFEHGRHGLISDTGEGLATATITVLGDDDKAAQYSAAGRLLADRYRWAPITAPLEVLYRTLIADRVGDDARDLVTGSG
jgi:glycosyltransferase involved in cell wall biosynthesis